MRISVKPDPNDQYMIINVNGELMQVANFAQDIEFEILSFDGERLAVGTSTDALKKALAMKPFANYKYAEQLVDHVVDAIVAERELPFAAKAGDDSVEVAPIDSDRIYLASELDWTFPQRQNFEVTPLKR